MAKICAVTGSFDPITVGHLNIIKRAKSIFDKVYVLMLINPDKEYAFTVDERMELLSVALRDLDVEVCFYEGYTADFCREKGIDILVRGVRNKSDFEYEKNLARLNYEYGKLETCFFMADDEYLNISSSIVREEIKEGKYRDYLPEKVWAVLEDKFNG